MSREKTSKQRRRDRSSKAAARVNTDAVSGLETAAAAAIALLAWMHLSSVVSDFRMAAGLHRWLITYANGFHRRGLIGSVFQFFFGDSSRAAQIEIASALSSLATHLWLLLSLVIFFYAVFRLRERALRWCALAFGALVFINPMWTTRAFDNGYTDWLAGLAVAGALAAFLSRKPVLSGAIAAFGIIGYWGTVFVWLPLGWLIALLIARDVWQNPASQNISRINFLLTAIKSRDAFAIFLPPAAALLTVLAHDNAAAVAELQRVGGQQNIIEETFTDVGGRLADQAQKFALAWDVYLALWMLYALPPLAASCCLVAALRRRGLGLLRAASADMTAAVTATLLPLLFLLPAFDWARLTLWTYTGFFTVAVVWMRCAQPLPAESPRSHSHSIGALMAAPLVLALLSLTTPTVYAWYDMNYIIECKRFCFKERTPQAWLLDAYRRTFLSSPIDFYHSPGALTPATRAMQAQGGARIVREGLDPAGEVMSLLIILNDKDQGVTVRAPGQTQRAVLGSGRYRMTIRYRSHGVSEDNAFTQFDLLPTLQTRNTILRASLPPNQTEYSAVISAPPGLAGNLFGWKVAYSGRGVFELHEVSLQKISEW